MLAASEKMEKMKKKKVNNGEKNKNDIPF